MEKFRNPGVGESVLTELKQVYRSTPQITAFLRDLDASFPAMDLEGEYATYVAESQQEDGETPTLTVYETDIKLVDSVFEKAASIARDIDGGGSQVAVLWRTCNSWRKGRLCTCGGAKPIRLGTGVTSRFPTFGGKPARSEPSRNGSFNQG